MKTPLPNENKRISVLYFIISDFISLKLFVCFNDARTLSRATLTNSAGYRAKKFDVVTNISPVINKNLYLKKNLFKYLSAFNVIFE